MPAAFNGGTAGCPVATSPRQQRCANSSSKRQTRTPQTGLLRNELQPMLLVRLQSNACCSLTCFVSTRPSFKDCSQEGFSESPRFNGCWIEECLFSRLSPTATVSDRIAVLLVACFQTNGTHETDYSTKPPSRYRVYSMSLADTSNTRQPDHLVL